MDEVCFEAAKVVFHLRGSTIFTDPLRAIYSAFPPAGLNPVGAYEITWHPEGLCQWRSLTTARHGQLRLHSPAFAPVVTTFLVGRLMEEANPGLLTLHGNALLSPKEDRLLLLVGASGSGKSTLSQELAAWGYRQVSEDLLLIGQRAEGKGQRELPSANLSQSIGTSEQRPATDNASPLPSALCPLPCLFPFPRAAALRAVRPGEEGLPWIAPGGGSSEGRRKHILPSTIQPSAEPLPLAHCTVVILQEPTHKREPSIHSPQEESFPPRPSALSLQPSVSWLTWSNDALISALREAGIPVADVRQENDLSCLSYSAPLSPEQWQRQFEILEAAGAMLLSGGTDGASPATPAGFPPQPHSAPLGSSQGVEACLPHLRRYRPLPPHAAARQFITLARAFQTARFLSFASGGTPEEAGRALKQVVEENAC